MLDRLEKVTKTKGKNIEKVCDFIHSNRNRLINQ